MLQTSKRYILIILPIGIMLVAALGVATRGFGLYQEKAPLNKRGLDVSRLSMYHIPRSLQFCGEKMPLRKIDVRERMEQAFYIELSDAQIILDLKRSTIYFPYIRQQLEQMGLPEDLKYLPVAESALRNLVSSRGAAGIWQFTPETARRYGLKVNYYVDERYNFDKATVAALRYLNDLHTMFGSWTLAAAAYNMGRYGIESTIDHQRVDNYYSLFLNEETSRFVFRIVALKQIMSHYKTYGFDLRPDDFYELPETRTLSVSAIPNLIYWARQQGTTYKEIRYLNPWIKHQELPHGTWNILLPQDARPETLASGSLSSGDSISAERSNVTYKVRRGDSLIKIAEMYGVSVQDLVNWNELHRRRLLRAGERLTIFPNDSESEQRNN